MTTTPAVVVKPAVYARSVLIPADLADALIRVTVDEAIGLPGMVELVFDADRVADEVLAGLPIGTEVAVAAAAPVRWDDPRLLIRAEVVAHEAEYGERTVGVVRAYTADHRLQRVRRTRAFADLTDADIARRVALDNNLVIGEITPGRVVYPQAGQLNQTDWEFLTARAAAIGYETGIEDGRFFFRQPRPVAPVSLLLGANLTAFSPRITVGNLAARTEVRAWDSLAAETVSEQVRVTGHHHSADPIGVTGQTVVTGRAVPAQGPLGPVVREQAMALAEAVAGTSAEAVGTSTGDPWLSAGRIVEVSGVAAPFAGRWRITRVRHELEDGEYVTRFEVSGRQDRSLLGLTRTPVPPDRIHGVVCAIVSNVADPRRCGRVKLLLPWFSPDYETGWASVVQAGAGERSGALFLPEVGDQVLAGFELGDIQRPFVLGGILSARSRYQLGGPAIGPTGAVQWRGMVAPSGGRLAFHDVVGDQGTVDQGVIQLGSGDGNLTLRIDQVAGTVALQASPSRVSGPGTKGRLVIECGPGGAIDVVAGAGGSVTVDGGAALTLKGQQITLDGARISVNGSGPVEVKGRPIKLN